MPCAFPVDKTQILEVVLGYLWAMRRLLIRPGAIGDFIVSLPALECLRDAYTEVWTAGANVPLVRFADGARSIAASGLDLLGIADPPARLLEDLARFDSIISWYGANREEFRAEVARLGLPFHFFPALPAAGAGMHAIDFYLAQARTLVDCSSDGIPRIACEAEPGNFAVIHPFSSSPRKNWPLEKFRALAVELEKTLPVKWCAGPEDPPLPEAVHIADLWDLARWLKSARLYVGNDCGITHLAAAVGTPVLAFFGPTDPEIWGPRGPHVQIGRW